MVPTLPSLPAVSPLSRFQRPAPDRSAATAPSPGPMVQDWIQSQAQRRHEFGPALPVAAFTARSSCLYPAVQGSGRQQSCGPPAPQAKSPPNRRSAALIAERQIRCQSAMRTFSTGAAARRQTVRHGEAERRGRRLR